MSEPDSRRCECGCPDDSVRNPHVPVEFDEQMNEYHLVRDGARRIMRYCFWCGGRLPESKRGTFFTTPDAAELVEVRALLQDAHSAEDVVKILGPPDEVRDGKGETYNRATGKAIVRWEQSYRYSTRWKSLVVVVPVVLEGRFAYSIRGHYLGGGQPEKTPT